MEDLDPQVIAALARAAKGNPELRSAASAIFAALKRRDEREQEAWAIVRDVAEASPYYSEQPDGWFCTMCNGWEDGGMDREAALFGNKFGHDSDCPVTRARALLGGE